MKTTQGSGTSMSTGRYYAMSRQMGVLTHEEGKIRVLPYYLHEDGYPEMPKTSWCGWLPACGHISLLLPGGLLLCLPAGAPLVSAQPALLACGL